MRHFDAVIFDVDGTLLDTTEGIMSSVRYTIARYSLSELSDRQLLSFIGPPIQKSFIKAYDITENDAQELAVCFRRHYKEYDLYKAKPYDGIYDTISRLKKNGVCIAVATYKREDYARDIITHFGFDRYSDIICGADNNNKLTKTDIIINAVNKTGADNAGAVMVGDSDNDAGGAKGAGISFIGVTYGFGFHDDSVYKFENVGIAGCPEDISGLIINE